MITAVLGPPGTGKTHYLINKVQEILGNTSIQPEQIGYFSFTNRAADEAKQRTQRTLELPAHKLPYFRTLHSMAFYQLGLNRNLVFGREAMEKFAHWLGLELTVGLQNAYTTDDTWPDKTEDDHTLFLMNLARVSMLPEICLEDQPWQCHWKWAKRTIQGYQLFKQTKYLYDFSDMLEQLVKRAAYPLLDVIVIDESQDLSPLQWNVVNGLIEFNPRAKVFIAGDDDQAIYQWAGASVGTFLDVIETAGKSVLLDHSHRVPAAAFSVAQHAIGHCKERRVKTWYPTEQRGKIEYQSAYEDIWWDQDKSYLCLARNNYLLKRAVQFLNDYKLPWSWITDKRPTPIKLSTIHGAKGAQADTVVLDLGMAKAAYNDGWVTDDEARVWYVAVTRAKNELIFMEPVNSSTSSLYIGSPFSYSAYIGN